MLTNTDLPSVHSAGTYFVPTGAMRAAAAYVENEWGADGYRLAALSAHAQADADGTDHFWYRFGVIARDGGYFEILADRWENTADVPEHAHAFRY